MPTTTAYGLDYSARELTPEEIAAYNRANPQQQISFLIRYIGYSTNPKCISHYPGALQRFEKAGVLVLLVHQVGYLDFHGGYNAGRQHALVALADAQRQGYPDSRPIFFAFDRWLAGDPKRGIPPLPIEVVWQYLAGVVSVLGWARTGLYGFWDVIHPAIRENRVLWTWLCGDERFVVDGVDIYQWNNGRVWPGTPALESDLNKSYVDLTVFNGRTTPKGSGDVTTFVRVQGEAGGWADEMAYLLNGPFVTGLEAKRVDETLKSWPGSCTLIGITHEQLLDLIEKSEALRTLGPVLGDALSRLSLGGDPKAFATAVAAELRQSVPDDVANEIDERQRERLGVPEPDGTGRA